MVHTCPQCELRFTTSTELTDHLAIDHAAEAWAFEPYRYAGKRPAAKEGKRYLVVGNETLHASVVVDRIRSLADSGPATFFLLVPATRKDRDRGLASWRLREMVDRLHAAGVDAEGVVGEHDPYHAVAELLEHDRFDEIIVSTLPAGLSKWLDADLASRLERHFELPVTTITQPA